MMRRAGSLTPEEAIRAHTIRRILDDPRGNTRARIYATPDRLERLCAATSSMPQFWAVSGIIERALIQSMRTGQPLTFPPILMVSPPGQGKTHYASKLADALDTTCITISMPQTSERGSLGGLAPVWRGAGLGRLAHGILVSSRTASPLFVIDELDKPARHSDDPTEVLLNALEPVSARCFQDEYLRAPCDLSAALWLASANDVSRIAGPVADRFVIIEVPQADREQTRIIVESIAKTPLADAGLIGLDDRAVEVLANLRPRRMRLTIELGCAFAVTAGRGVLTGADVSAALALMQQRGNPSIGFLR